MKVNDISKHPRHAAQPAPTDRRSARAENRSRRNAARRRALASGTAAVSAVTAALIGIHLGSIPAAAVPVQALASSVQAAYTAPIIQADAAAALAFTRSAVASIAAPRPAAPEKAPDPDRRLHEILTASSGKPDTEQRKNTLGSPLTDRSTSSPFGERVSPLHPTERDFHRGEDFAANCGVDVMASAAGKVIFAGVHAYGGGNRVEIEHASGLKTTYNHLQTFSVKVGEEVKRGEVIAKVGSTGASTGCHLHFEVYLGKDVVDPKDWF